MGNLCCMGRAKPVALAPPVLWKAPPAELFIGPFTDPEWGPWPPPAGTPPPAKAAPLLPPPPAARPLPAKAAPPVLWKAPPAELFIGPMRDPEWFLGPPPAGTPPPAKAAPLLPPPLAGGAPQPAASRGAPQPAVSRFGICLPRASSRAQADALAARPAPAARVALSIMHVVRTIRNFLVRYPHPDLTGLYDLCLLNLFEVYGLRRPRDWGPLDELRRNEGQLRRAERRQARHGGPRN